MNAQAKSRRDVVAEHVYGLGKKRAKQKGNRVKKLEGKDAREGVINNAAWRLMQIDSVFPHALRQKLKPIGNIGLRRIDPTLWQAWMLVHRYYIELGTFWYEDSDAQNELIDKALDAERNAYIRASDRSAWEALAPYAVAFTPVKLGPLLQPLPANSVTDVIEQEEFEAEEVAAEDAREKIEAEENARLRAAVAVYERKLRRKHRAALRLVCGPRLPNGMIAARCGVAEATVAKIRADVCDIADGILTVPEDDVVETLRREFEVMKQEIAVLKAAERRRDAFLQNHSTEEYNALRAWALPFCDALGQSVDDLLGATIVPKPST